MKAREGRKPHPMPVYVVVLSPAKPSPNVCIPYEEREEAVTNLMLKLPETMVEKPSGREERLPTYLGEAA